MRYLLGIKRGKVAIALLMKSDQNRHDFPQAHGTGTMIPLIGIVTVFQHYLFPKTFAVMDLLKSGQSLLEDRRVVPANGFLSPD
jgi:hypothetical protein